MMMIAEQAAIQHPTRSPLAPAQVATAIDAVPVAQTRSSGRRKRLSALAAHGAMSLLRALALSVKPLFFELARRVRIERRLGPGLSRVSDSFWPISEW